MNECERHGERFCVMCSQDEAIAALRAERDALRAQLAERDATIAEMRAALEMVVDDDPKCRELLTQMTIMRALSSDAGKRHLERDAARDRVVEAASAWRESWRHRLPFGDEQLAVALVDAVDAMEGKS